MTVVKDMIIKTQKYEYMRRFLLYGEMYMNTLQCFALMDESDGIGDKFENLLSYTHYKPIKAVLKFKNGEEIEIHPTNVKVRVSTEENKGNIYSMALVDVELKTINGEHILSIQSKDVIQSIGNDYDTIVLITDPNQFISRCQKAANDLGYKLFYGRVEYFTDDNYNKKIEITPFMKRDKYKAQKEFRLFIDFNSNTPQLLKIGNISDIAILIHKSGINSISCAVLPECL